MLLALLPIAALSAGSAFAGSPGDEGGATKPDTAHDSLAAILYSQFDHFAGSSAKSARPPYHWDGYTSYAADDFIVPAGETWHVTKVEFEVAYWVPRGIVGPVNVYFFLDDGNAEPGVLIASETMIGPSSGDHDTHVVVPLPTAVNLFSAHWWISVQSNVYQDSNIGCWSWLNRTVMSHSPAQWTNPGGSEGHGCQTWGLRAICWNQNFQDFDQVFLLRGEVR
jgi:hypothetical protein